MIKVYIPQASSLGLFNDAGPRVVAFAFNNMYGERVCVVPFFGGYDPRHAYKPRSLVFFPCLAFDGEASMHVSKQARSS
jgi:hypothetical protein